jgi:glycosyltransferase involved in cell wall biosynthesis
LELEYAGRPVNGLLRWRAERILRENLHLASAVVCVSEPARRQLLARWPVNASKVAVIPNGVDAERFRPDGVARARGRAAIGAGEEPILIFVGSFFDWHDVPTLLEAFVEVRARRRDIRLVLVGDGPTRAAMEARARDLGLSDATRFMGLVGHRVVPDLIAAADVAVAPYPALDLWHSPLKLYEYLASGATVVASRTGQVAEVIRDGENGLLVEPGNVPALASALFEVIGSPELRYRLGRQAREDAVRYHSWDRYLARLEDLFAEVIGRASHRERLTALRVC